MFPCAPAAIPFSTRKKAERTPFAFRFYFYCCNPGLGMSGEYRFRYPPTFSTRSPSNKNWTSRMASIRETVFTMEYTSSRSFLSDIFSICVRKFPEKLMVSVEPWISAPRISSMVIPSGNAGQTSSASTSIGPRTSSSK